MLRGMYNTDTFKQLIEMSGAPPAAVRVGDGSGRSYRRNSARARPRRPGWTR